MVTPLNLSSPSDDLVTSDHCLLNSLTAVSVEMELEKSDKSKDRRPKGDDVDIAPSSDQDNSDNHSVDWQPPAMKWMLAATPEDPINKSHASTPALSSTTFAWNHPTPATVAVQRGHKRLRVKQPDLHRPVCSETAGAPASQFGRQGDRHATYSTFVVNFLILLVNTIRKIQHRSTTSKLSWGHMVMFNM